VQRDLVSARLGPDSPPSVAAAAFVRPFRLPGPPPLLPLDELVGASGWEVHLRRVGPRRVLFHESASGEAWASSARNRSCAFRSRCTRSCTPGLSGEKGEATSASGPRAPRRPSPSAAIPLEGMDGRGTPKKDAAACAGTAMADSSVVAE